MVTGVQTCALPISLIDYYTEKNILVEVDGTVDIDEVFAAIVNVLGA